MRPWYPSSWLSSLSLLEHIIIAQTDRYYVQVHKIYTCLYIIIIQCILYGLYMRTVESIVFISRGRKPPFPAVHLPVRRTPTTTTFYVAEYRCQRAEILQAFVYVIFILKRIFRQFFIFLQQFFIYVNFEKLVCAFVCFSCVHENQFSTNS